MPINLASKQAVQICSCCKQGMCATCVIHSQKELEGSILSKYEFEICRNCIATVRRSEALKPKLEMAVRKAVQEVKLNLRIELYTLTNTPVWQQSLKH